jgi:hypothetical protein
MFQSWGRLLVAHRRTESLCADAKPFPADLILSTPRSEEMS